MKIIVYCILIFLAIKILKPFVEYQIMIRGIVSSFLGGKRPPLVKKENALEVCRKWHICIPAFEREEEDTEACCVCNSPGRFSTFERLSNTPLTYYWLKNHNPWNGESYRKLRKNPLVGEYFRKKNIEISDGAMGGRQFRLAFCSRECYASFKIWSFYIPVNKTESMRRFGKIFRYVLIKELGRGLKWLFQWV